MVNPFVRVRFWPESGLFPAVLGRFVAVTLAQPVSLLAIDGYQRYVSPHKGYRCAHGVLYGGPSCSEFGQLAVRGYGVIGAFILLRSRFEDCRHAAMTLRRSTSQSAIGQTEADECVPSDRERGRKDAEQTGEYCIGCLEGCCGG